MSLKFLAVAVLGLAMAACTTNEDKPATSGSAQNAVTTTTSPPPKVNTETVAVNAPRPGSQEELNATVGDRVFFDFDRYNLSAEARSTVGSWAAWMKQHQNVSLKIEGHADERGTREYNLALGARRANAVKDYLTALGVAGSRVQTVSFGKERPAVLGSNDSAWAQNRRSAAVVR